MSEIAVSLLLLLSFNIGFMLGVLTPIDFSKPKKKDSKRKIRKISDTNLELNEEYQNFLSYDGSIQQ